MGKWLGRLIFLVSGITLLAHWALVPLAEKALIQAASSTLEAEEVAIKIHTFPPWKLLQGRLDELTWQVEGVRFQELTLARLEGQFSGVEVSWWELWHKKDFNYFFQEPGLITCTLTEENLQEYLCHRLKAPLEDLKVSIIGQQLKLTANWTMAGQKLSLLLVGRLTLEGVDALRLIPERIQMGSFTPGPEIQERLLGNTVFYLPLDSLPVSLEMYELQGEEGKIIVKGRSFLKGPV